MFGILVNYYIKDQNSFVKHNDAVIEEEIYFYMILPKSYNSP